MRKTPLKFCGILTIFLSLLAAAGPAHPQAGEGVAIPNYFDPRERLVRPEGALGPRLRFLTTTDFPPFNFLDRNGRLAGLHIDLIRAICAELGVEIACQVQALPWDELAPALEAGEGEAIVAGLAISGEARARFRFTRSFLRLPARFVERRSEDAASGRSAAEATAGEWVGVMGGTAHEAMLRSHFPDARPIVFSGASFLYDALKSGEVTAVFGDGVQLSFWLGSAAAEECCRFLDGPVFSEAFLGHGLAIAVARDNADLAAAFDHAILALSNSGRLGEIYLRYFPNGLY